MTNKKRVKRKKKEEKNLFSIGSIIMIPLGVVFIVLMYDMLFGISFSTTSYETLENTKLEIPKFMTVSSDSNGKLELKTYRSVAAISKDMKKIRKGNKKIVCSEKDYYYNNENDFSMSYQIRRGLLFNYLTIEYQKGEITCSLDQEDTSTKHCSFIRTYYVDLVKPNQEEEKIYVTLSEYQGDTETIELPSLWRETLVVGKNYEFTFEQIGNKKASEEILSEIFKSYVVTNIVPTEFIGLEQKQEPICK